jgi:hypothetical protein
MKDSPILHRASRPYDVETLVREFGDALGRDTILKVLGRVTEELKDARFKQYVSLFAYRFARERLATMRAARLCDDHVASAHASALAGTGAQNEGPSGT